MKRSTIILLSVAGVLFILVMWVRSMYNGIIETEGTVDQKFADIQTQYQRRFDLIPQLVATVQMNAENEKEIITKVTQYRAGITDAKNAGDIEKMEPMARDIRTAINLQVEAYPNLKSPDAFRDLQAQLEGTENRIAKARSDYNEAVRGYNVRIKRFPTNMFNAMFGFEPRESFKADEGSDKAVDVREEFGKGKNAAE
ncbi:MAG TPA: LemA family protein [Flavobacteriales bacterium]|nr:LemA family protein [Flavobacteriales bacterium]HRE73928.1 LemA family protein [Flavobacteriales bacterium]HRE97083.1 LemA family protein [Flavobacteriales bacterium]HRJ36286.1 LemA family protein [Flavobacteriales bacterium]